MKLYSKVRIPNYTEQQQEEIITILRGCKRFFFWLILQCQFVRKHEQDDYFQHVQLTIWLRYKEFDRSKGAKMPWLKMVAKSAIIRYHRFLNIDRKKTDYVPDHASWYDEADDIYSEQHIESLNNAISDLPDKYQGVVQLYLTGANMSKESKAIGKNHEYLTSRMDGAKKWIRANHYRYFQGITITDNKPWKGWTGGYNNENAGCKPIHMLTLDGRFIKRYPSIMEAVRDGFDSRALYRCLNKGGSHEGYRWIYEGEQRAAILNWESKRTMEHQEHAQPVEQWSISGEYIQTFPTMAAAARAGFSPGNIHKVLKGVCQQHKGFKWRLPVSDQVHNMTTKAAV